ncbi:MAG: cobyrinate a,c-diamide synthase, partial [Candidatus Aquicultorales bacterium]
FVPPMPVSLGERHLGLVTAVETGADADRYLDEVADELGGLDIDAFLRIAGYAAGKHSDSKPEERPIERETRIGVAYDAAFNFYYRENLEELGRRATIVRFSPLDDPLPPKVDGFYIGGGFPEVHAERLSANAEMREALGRAIAGGTPVYAECGGLLYLGRGLLDLAGRRHPMVGALAIECGMSDKLTLGYVEMEAVCDSILHDKGDTLRGHQFHRTAVREDGEGSRAYRETGGGGLEGYAKGGILASYTHLHFLGKGGAADKFVGACSARRRLTRVSG